MIRLVNYLEAPYELQLESRNWRNSEHVAKYFQITHIALEQHKRWLESLSRTPPETIAFFVEFQKIFVGVVYFHSIDYAQKHCEWGIYIHDVSFRGKKIGQRALHLSMEYAKNVLGMTTVSLEVLRDNHVAVSLYEKMGFVFSRHKSDTVMRYVKHLQDASAM